MTIQRRHFFVSCLLAASLLLTSCQGKGKPSDGTTQSGDQNPTAESGDQAAPVVTQIPVPTPEDLTEKIQVVPDLNLQLAWSYGSCGNSDDQLDKPMGVAVDAKGNSYVTDTGNHRIVVLDPSGSRISMFGAQGTELNQFEQPVDVSVASDGSLYIADSEQSKIKHYSADGNPLDEFGLDLGMYHPRGIGLGIASNVWIADTGVGRVVEADLTGAQKQILGGTDNFILGKGQPTDAAVNSKGNLWIVEASNGMVWSIAPDGTVRKTLQITVSGSEDGPHLVVDAKDSLWVSDSEGVRILAFNPDGTMLGKLVQPPDGTGQFKRPVGIGVDASGSVIITDPPNCKVVKYSPQG